MLVPISISGGEANYSSWEQLESQLSDMEAPLSRVGETILETVAKMFETEGASGGRPWDELTELYREWKETHGPGLPILIGLKPAGDKATRQRYASGKAYTRSGKMREELIAPSALKIDKTRLLYAPESDIAGFHQEGTPRMVERPPVIINPSQEVEFESLFGEWLDLTISDAGF